MTLLWSFFICFESWVFKEKQNFTLPLEQNPLPVHPLK